MLLVPALYLRRVRSSSIRLVVLHTAEVHERPNSALGVANYFAGKLGPLPRKVSSHYAADAQVAVQCVDERDVAYHAGIVNDYSIGVELAGFAAQTSEEWADAFSLSELAVVADLVRDACLRWALPMQKRGPEELKLGYAGICGHWDVTQAWPEYGDHTDPGGSFPWHKFIEMTRGGVSLA